MSKFTLKLFLLFFSFTPLTHASPDQLPGNIALHIAKTHYLHPVRLLHPFLDYWHMKGPLAEQSAMASLQKHFASVTECEKGSEANVVLLLEPHMFYNPQLKVFHAEYIARVYTSDGEPITRIKKQAKQIGPLNIAPEFYMQKGYTKAMDKIIKKLSTDQAFLDSLKTNNKIKAGTICSNLDQQPLEKLYY